MEQLLTNLLIECEKYISPELIYSQKWMQINDRNLETKKIKNIKQSIITSYFKKKEFITGLSIYKKLKSNFENDEVFSSASQMAGYWGGFEAIFQEIIMESGSIIKNKINFDKKKAITILTNKRNGFSGKFKKVSCKCKLIGISLNQKKIKIDDELYLYRLNTKELNQERQFINPLLNDSTDSLALSQVNTEIRLEVNIEIKKEEEMPIFSANNKGHEKITKKLNDFIDAIQLAKEGEFELGPKRFYSELVGDSISSNIYQPVIFVSPNTKSLKTSETSTIISSFRLTQGELSNSDNIIPRSLHRFLLGRKRRNSVDKFIDFVIAWESILLTQNGNGGNSELSYRFSLNGSSILAMLNKNSDKKRYFKIMKEVYNLRSAYVHGGSQSKIDSAIKKTELHNIEGVCFFLEKNFRSCIWWLMKKNQDERPYIKPFGWEDLLWEKA